MKLLLALLIAMPAQARITGKDRLPEHVAFGYITSTAISKVVEDSDLKFLWSFIGGCAVGFAKESMDHRASIKDAGFTCIGAGIASKQWSW